MFQKWDVDGGKSIGRYVRAVSGGRPDPGGRSFAFWEKSFGKRQLFRNKRWRSQCTDLSTTAQALDLVVWATCDSLLVGGACGAATTLYCGVGCSLCTLCLSWLPWCCIAKATESKLNDPEEMRKHEQAVDRAYEHALQESKKAVKKKLLKGPSKALLTRSEAREDDHDSDLERENTPMIQMSPAC